MENLLFLGVPILKHIRVTPPDNVSNNSILGFLLDFYLYCSQSTCTGVDLIQTTFGTELRW